MADASKTGIDPWEHSVLALIAQDRENPHNPQMVERLEQEGSPLVVAVAHQLLHGKVPESLANVAEPAVQIASGLRGWARGNKRTPQMGEVQASQTPRAGAVGGAGMSAGSGPAPVAPKLAHPRAEEFRAKLKAAAVRK